LRRYGLHHFPESRPDVYVHRLVAPLTGISQNGSLDSTLRLNELEKLDTRNSLGTAWINIIAAATSITIAAPGGKSSAGFAGMSCPFLPSPSLTIFHSVMGGKRRKFMEAVQQH
jgi:hypothetical protein